MKTDFDSKHHDAPAVPSNVDPDGTDWKAVASQRLGRLVEIEHKHALLVRRYEALQVDHRDAIGDDVARLRRIRTLEYEGDVLRARNEALCAVETRLLNSLSWRVTRPMRIFSRSLRNPPGLAKKSLLRLARLTPLRRVLKTVLRWMPGLRRRVEAFMYTGNR